MEEKLKELQIQTFVKPEMESVLAYLKK